jgi:patatin-related protein
MPFEPQPVTELTQELRLATTMTGGVSLAIWMAGVAREINLLAQASQWRRRRGPFPSDSQLPPASAESLRLYAGLIDLLDTVVDVDVLSGTSAGGIGAALLASSRATGSDLGGLRDLWLDLGALTDLLRDPTDKNTPSLLYGDERMYAELAQQIPQLPTGPFPPLANVLPSTTLYVTTTLLTAETSRFTDSYGTLVQDVDRRGILTFTEADLANNDNSAALALAARSSASFPVAFEPSFLPFTNGTARKGAVPARPPMAPYANITRPHWAADGGLLDNQPIDVLLKRIFDRRARRAVRRVLLFVVPSAGPAPDVTQQAPQDDVNEPLGLVGGVLKDVAAVTTQSIAADLRAIRAHQDRMEARTDTKLHLAELAALPAATGSRLLNRSLLADYRKREAARHAQVLTAALLRQLSTWPPTSDGSTEGIPEHWQSELAIGGDAERVCRQRIADSIQQHWPQSIPETTADLARYGQPAYNLSKACAIAVARAAYQLATSADHMTALAKLTEDIHAACAPPAPIDLAALVHQICTEDEVRNGSLENAAHTLAGRYLAERQVHEDAWDGLGAALVTCRATMTTLAGKEPSALLTYLKYLDPLRDPPHVARKLFDLATTQRAMLPAGADIEQSLELVQVSADTRSLLAPDWKTAQDKLTGMQFHHFGAFYKRSWRANDWMWGRLDGAGWLVHVVLDPRRVQWIVQARASEYQNTVQAQPAARWLLGRLKALGSLDLPTSGGLTEAALLTELEFLDDSARPLPPSIPLTALWLAQAWQRHVLDEELDGLAKAVVDPQPGKPPDWSPTKSRSWAEQVLATPAGDAKYRLLNSNPVATETFATDKGSPLMARTVTKAAANAAAAAGSIRQLPGVLKPALITLRTLTLAAYRVVSLTNGVAKSTIVAGAVLLILGTAAAIQSAGQVGAVGLIVAGVGGYLIVLGTWQRSSRTLFALFCFTLVGAVLALTTQWVRTWLFGTDKDHPGLVGSHVYWVGTQWWHPLIVVGVITLVLALTAAAKPRRK